MPFPLLYRAATGRVEAVELRGMPPGSFPEFPYPQRALDLASLELPKPHDRDQGSKIAQVS